MTRVQEFCVLIKSARKHVHKRTHMDVRNCFYVYACNQRQTHADTSVRAYIYVCIRTLNRIYAHTIPEKERFNYAYVYI